MAQRPSWYCWRRTSCVPGVGRFGLVALHDLPEIAFNNMTLLLDRYFVHRLPGADYEGKDGNPLNEVRIVCDSLMNNNGIMRGDKQIKLTPERSVLKLNVGDPIKLTEEDFERLSAAFFVELKRRFR